MWMLRALRLEKLSQNCPFRSVNYCHRKFNSCQSKLCVASDGNTSNPKLQHSNSHVNGTSALNQTCLPSVTREGLQRLHTSAAALGQKVDRSRVPCLKEEELEEKFVRGSGPGGQSVNRTASACSLRHIPTGIVVKCHEERSLHRNREIARRTLIERLDELYNGDMSVAAQLRRLQEAKRTKAQQKSQKREAMKRAWREREGID